MLTGNDEMEIGQLKVFPNPASDFVVLESEEPITSVLVYNYTGQVVMKETINNKSYKLDISSLKAGTYFLIMETGSKSVSRQIVKE